VYQLIKAEEFIAGFDHEGVDILLRVLAMIVQKDKRRIPWVHQGAVRRCHWLVNNIIADVVLEKAVFGHRFA